MFDFPLYSEHVSEFRDLEHIAFRSANTILLIAADANGISTELISTIAKRYISAGLIYVCIWGPDCSRVHDIFDMSCAENGSNETSVLMTTWHDNESLDEAIWFFLNCAFPLDHQTEKTSFVAITVGNTAWAQNIEKALADLPAFSERILTNQCEHVAEELFLELDREENSGEPSA